MDLEAIAVRRADEQLAAYDVGEPVTHDPWAIRPTQYQGRANGKGKAAPRRRCLAGDCARRVVAHGYCHMHHLRILRGESYDSDLMRFTSRERRAVGLSAGGKAGSR